MNAVNSMRRPRQAVNYLPGERHARTRVKRNMQKPNHIIIYETHTENTRTGAVRLICAGCGKKTSNIFAPNSKCRHRIKGWAIQRIENDEYYVCPECQEPRSKKHQKPSPQAKPPVKKKGGADTDPA